MKFDMDTAVKISMLILIIVCFTLAISIFGEAQYIRAHANECNMRFGNGQLARGDLVTGNWTILNTTT